VQSEIIEPHSRRVGEKPEIAAAVDLHRCSSITAPIGALRTVESFCPSTQNTLGAVARRVGDQGNIDSSPSPRIRPVPWPGDPVALIAGEDLSAALPNYYAMNSTGWTRVRITVALNHCSPAMAPPRQALRRPIRGRGGVGHAGAVGSIRDGPI
jgi:hypothetical protein